MSRSAGQSWPDDHEEVTERFRQLRATGDRSLRDQLVQRHLSIAQALARRFAGRGESMDDLTQVASLALVRAVDRFDPDTGVPFAGFAVPTILGELKRHFRDRAWGAKVNRSVKELVPRVTAAIDDLTGSLGRSPTPSEVADHIGCGVEEVIEAIDARGAYRPRSLQAPSGGEGNSTIGDLVGGDGRDHDHAVDRLAVRQLLATLPDRERRIVELRYFEDLSQSDIAVRMGISQMHVSRLLRKAVELMAVRAGDTDGMT